MPNDNAKIKLQDEITKIENELKQEMPTDDLSPGSLPGAIVSYTLQDCIQFIRSGFN